MDIFQYKKLYCVRFDDDDEDDDDHQHSDQHDEKYRPPRHLPRLRRSTAHSSVLNITMTLLEDQA